MSEQWFENDKGLSVREIVKLESSYRVDSLVSAIEELINEKEENGVYVNDSELVVLTVEAVEREVNSGGFSQFFSNSSIVYTPYLVECLRRIGSTQAKALAEEAIAVLDVEKLKNTPEYYVAIQKAIDDDTVMETLEKIDSRYYEIDEDIAGLVFEFIKNHLNDYAL